MKPADFAFPISAALASICFYLSRLFANGSTTILWIGSAMGIVVGVLTYLSLRRKRISSPDPKSLAAESYWKAYVDANENLGQRSLSADQATKELKNRQRNPSGLEPKRRRQARPADYWYQYHKQAPRVRVTDFTYDDLEFSRDQPVKLGHYGSDYVDPSGWRSEVPMPVFKPGQSAAAYWKQFDEMRLVADQLTLAERMEVSATGQLPQKRSEAMDLKAPPLSETQKNVHFYEDLPPHLALIRDTNASRALLARSAKVHSGDLGDSLGKMLASVDSIILGLKDDPMKLVEVQRLFTYYLPEVGKLLDARDQMQSIGETVRVSEIDSVLYRIEKAFQQFATRMHQLDIRALDIDLKLLDQSLAAEFETQIGTQL
jgi:hypothetical protein